jgi:phosphopantetheinyl transferase (holo-ACP synthase)
VVGNDIIDIRETKRTTNWKRSGFLQKVFTQKEQELIRDSTNPFTTVWQLWSMKESAYKVFIQAGADSFFNPSRIECDVESLENGQVRIDETSIKTNTTLNPKYIFTTAVLNDSEIKNCVCQLAESNTAFQTKLMQEHVISAFAKQNSLNSIDLKIEKTKTGVPKLFHKNELLNTSFSITHHGKYGAYSIVNN